VRAKDDTAFFWQQISWATLYGTFANGSCCNFLKGLAFLSRAVLLSHSEVQPHALPIPSLPTYHSRYGVFSFLDCTPLLRFSAAILVLDCAATLTVYALIADRLV